MRGEVIGVWSETWREIWVKLAKNREYGDGLFSDFYRELVREPQPPEPPPPPTAFTDEGELSLPEDIAARDAYQAAFEVYETERAKYEEAVSGGDSSRKALHDTIKTQITTEEHAVNALESAYSVVASYDDDDFKNKYFQLVEQFLQKYSLRYDLRRPFTLHPTLPGVFAQLFRELKRYTSRDGHLHQLMQDFEDALRDLRVDPSPARIKTTLQKQFNLLEAMGSRCPGVTGNTLGRICDEVGTWPHAKLKDAMKNMYGFASDYPGIRHGGNLAHQLREIEMRDLVAVSVVLAGFAPYLTDQINSETVYRGS
ncbi:MAG: hypothetical protein AB2809_08495 [Candidatus Thiodiazotropha sp.]